MKNFRDGLKLILVFLPLMIIANYFMIRSVFEMALTRRGENEMREILLRVKSMMGSQAILVALILVLLVLLYLSRKKPSEDDSKEG